jgi:DNA-binding response OmpR family regulator
MNNKILVVDDDESFLRFMIFNLERAGYQGITASNGIDGFHKALNENPILIFLDIMMPIEDGYSALLKLKKSHTTKPIPVVMITAKNKARDVCELHDIAGYIVKPVLFQTILAKIKEVTK